VAELEQIEARWLNESGLSSQLTRTAPPSAAYACHGWIFTGGRYALAGDPEEMILQDNGYREVAAPRAGDLAIYREAEAGTLMHLGLVRMLAPDRSPLVESKWAWMGRYLHPAGVYCYAHAVCKFYRSPRAGHLLRGLDGSPSAPAIPVPTT